jgi:hypothetical protein
VLAARLRPGWAGTHPSFAETTGPIALTGLADTAILVLEFRIAMRYRV